MAHAKGSRPKKSDPVCRRGACDLIPITNPSRTPASHHHIARLLQCCRETKHSEFSRRALKYESRVEQSNGRQDSVALAQSRMCPGLRSKTIPQSGFFHRRRSGASMSSKKAKACCQESKEVLCPSRGVLVNERFAGVQIWPKIQALSLSFGSSIPDISSCCVVDFGGEFRRDEMAFAFPWFGKLNRAFHPISPWLSTSQLQPTQTSPQAVQPQIPPKSSPLLLKRY